MGAPEIITGLKITGPCSFARDRQGMLYICNGFDKPRLWDGLTDTAFNAGIKAPAGAPSMSIDASGGSMSAGDYIFAYQYVDLYNRKSELSAIATNTVTSSDQADWTIVSSSETDRVRWVDLYRSTMGESTTVYKVVRLANHGTITSSASNAGTLRFTCDAGHGLQTNAVITISGHSVAGYNTTHNVTRISDTIFDSNIAYSADGSGGTFVLVGYLNDGVADTTLDDNVALPILNDDNSLNARRQGLPPPECAVMAWFQDRMYYAVQRKYSQGAVTTTANSITITGVTHPDTGLGTEWIEEFGAYGNYYQTGKWWMQIENEPKPIPIATFNNSTSLFTTLANAPTLSQTAVDYVIFPDPEMFRNTLVYSEVDEGESVPYDTTEVEGKVIGYVNTVTIQENTGDDDEITGLMPYGYAMYVLKERHIYRLQNIANDPSVYMLTARGCLNNRTWCYHDGLAYLMDKSGIYAFDGQNVDPISLPIQNLWINSTINFNYAHWFFASVDPTNEVVRFHVRYSGDAGTKPYRALCYHTRYKGWWEEEYPWQLGGACKADIDNVERCLVGGVDEQIWKVNEGFTDGGEAITAVWRSGMFPVVRSAPQQSVAYEVAFEPLEDATLIARVYDDNSNTAVTASLTRVDDKGISVTAGSGDMEIAMDGTQSGWVRQEVGGRGTNDVRGRRWLSLELEAEAPDDAQVVVYGVLLEGVQGRG